MSEPQGIITQDEMDTLLKQVSDGEVEGASAADLPKGKVIYYDFRHPQHRLKGRLPLLEVINERFAERLAEELSLMIHQTVKVSTVAHAAHRMHEYTQALPATISLSRIQLEPLPGSALVCMDATLVFRLVDSFFGGSAQGRATPSGKRGFTPSERRLVERTLERVYTALSAAWAPVMAITPKFIRSEIPSQIKSPANPAEVAVATRFSVELPLGNGELHLVIPYLTLEPARALLTAAVDKPPTNNAIWRQEFIDAVLDSTIEIKGVVAETELSLGELMQLQPGDFIPLTQSQRALFYSDNIALFEATVGTANGMLNVRINELHQPPQAFSTQTS